MLLTPIDNDGVWFRYHTLLAEYLRQRLEADRGIEVPELHGRAALWYASHELWTEPVRRQRRNDVAMSPLARIPDRFS
jgi:LuxR family maltose regulon positive regulatory protein